MAAKASALLAFGLAVALGLQWAAAVDHIVGGSTGWTVPTSATFYQTWAKNQTFKEGDKLVFNFPTNAHNVLRVSKANYGSCTTTSALETHKTGPTTITLSKPGTFYYICGFPGHCAGGQKVSVTLGAATAASPSPAPLAGSPTPSAAVTSPTPSTTGTTPSPASSASPGSSPSSTSPSSSPSSTTSAPSPSAASSGSSLGGLVVVLCLTASVLF